MTTKKSNSSDGDSITKPALVPIVEKPKRSHVSVQNVSFAHNGAFLVTAGFNWELFVWNPKTGSLIRELGGFKAGHNSFIPYCVISADARYVYGCNTLGSIFKWNIKTGEEVQSFKIPITDELLRNTNYFGEVFTLNLDETIGFSSTPEKCIKIWNLSQGTEVATFAGHAGSIHTLQVLSDTLLLSATGYEPSLNIWDYRRQKIVVKLVGHTKGVARVDVTPDRKTVISASLDGTAIVWDLKSQKPKHILSGHKEECFNVRISHDGTRAVTSSEDKTLKVWDIASGRLLATLEGHSRYCPCLAFSPTDDLLLTGDFDGCLKLWSLKDYSCLQSIKNTRRLTAIYACAFSPDGKIAVAGDDYGRVYFYKVVHNQ